MSRSKILVSVPAQDVSDVGQRNSAQLDASFRGRLQFNDCEMDFVTVLGGGRSPIYAALRSSNVSGSESGKCYVYINTTRFKTSMLSLKPRGDWVRPVSWKKILRAVGVGDWRWAKVKHQWLCREHAYDGQYLLRTTIALDAYNITSYASVALVCTLLYAKSTIDKLDFEPDPHLTNQQHSKGHSKVLRSRFGHSPFSCASARARVDVQSSTLVGRSVRVSISLRI
ncbi:uncharacterized protein EV420DRAFT_1748291 [Desarmillaria tabescens]|uniref:Uncharacterized protein n=1 Tax=Armillaria tabescens TaxID=1929756 RepID=A0AA39KB78_ARMTA|nr:uncharacterized protein EV420DRAFT_1748291 [Desarmillaria tabescens]KAK0457941.1 hypothetical protein EV420DRAFT_1748291 [Desarmillaria tabescens]